MPLRVVRMLFVAPPFSVGIRVSPATDTPSSPRPPQPVASPPRLQPASPHRLRHRVTEIFGSEPSSQQRRFIGRGGSSRKVSGSRKVSQRSSTSRHPAVSGSRRPSVIRIELEKEVQRVKSNLGAKKPWHDALHVIAVVLTNAITSSACACAVAFLFAVASPHVAAVATALETSVKLCQLRVTGALLFTTIATLGCITTLSFLLSSTPTIRGRTKWRFLRSARRLVRSCWLVLLLTCSIAVGGVELLAWLDHHTSRHIQRAQVFVVFSVSWMAIVWMASTARRLHVQAEARLRGSIVPSYSILSATSLASTTESSVPIEATAAEATATAALSATACWTAKPQWHACRRDYAISFLSIVAAFVYLAASSAMDLDSRLQLLLFASGSIAIKVSLQEVVKTCQLRRDRHSPRLLIHAAITVPTIAIDAQIRLAFMQFGVGQTAVATTVSVVVCEVLFRTAKILRLRHLVSSRIDRSTGMHRILKRVHSKIAVRDVAVARAEYAHFLEWKSHVMQLHAAEVYADMHGEYISIGCTMAVLFILGDHSMYTLVVQSSGDAISGEQIVSMLAQIVPGLLVDYLLSVVEIIHEVPLYEAMHDDDTRVRSLLGLLLPSLAAVNVAAIAVFFMNASTAPAPPPTNGFNATSQDSQRYSMASNWNTASAWAETSVAISRGSVVEPAIPSLDVGERGPRGGPTESTFSVSSRSLLGGVKRRISHASSHGPSTNPSELWKEFQLVKRNILSNKPWTDGVAVMWIVLSNTITSIVVAWVAASVYAIGSPLCPMFSIPRKPLRASVPRGDALLFTTAIAAYFIAFACLGHAITKSCILADRLLSAYTAIPHSFRHTLKSYLRVVMFRVVLATVVGTGAITAMEWSRADFCALGRIQVLILLLVVGSYIDYSVRHSRRVRRQITETLRLEGNDAASARSVSAPSLEAIGAALDNSAAVLSVPTVSAFRRFSSMSIILRTGSSRTMLQKLVQGYRGFTVICMGAMFGYMHLALALRMDHQWQVMLFAAFSLTLKIAIQEATKRLFLSPSRKPSARTTHMVMTLPTIMVDAQIRMVFVQLGLSKASEPSSSVFTSSFIIVVCKILFRLAKIVRLRHTITSRLTHSRGMQRILRRVNSKIAMRDVTVARAEYSQFLDWKNQKLRLHAAEVYADMHGEYISIGLAMAVVFFFTGHPMFTLRGAEQEIPRQLASAAVQLATGLLFDYLASVVEGVHEVPLYEAIGDEGRALRSFMHVLLGALSVVNVGIVAVFLLSIPERI